MKSATEHLGPAQTEHTPTDHQAYGRSSRIHYILIAVLFVVAYLISIWLPAAPGTISLDFVSGLLFFWLAGGLITLGLLTFAAKR